jgi:hypothetical protein
LPWQLPPSALKSFIGADSHIAAMHVKHQLKNAPDAPPFLANCEPVAPIRNHLRANKRAHRSWVWKQFDMNDERRKIN